MAGNMLYRPGEYRSSWKQDQQYRLIIPVPVKYVEAIEAAMQPWFWPQLGGRLQIQVARFQANAAQAEQIMRWLGRVMRDTKAFSLWLNNFSGIPAHTLYMRVQETPQTEGFARQIARLNQYLKEYDLPTLQYQQKWRLPVMEQVSEAKYEKALNHLARIEFGMELPVTEVQLHAQECAQKQGTLMQRMMFAPLPDEYRQPWYAPQSVIVHA